MTKSTNETKEHSEATPNSKKAVTSPKPNKSPTASPKKSSDLITYKIRMLDTDQKPLEIAISKNDDGQILFNNVCEELGGIIERDYFGLRYMDKNNQRQWLDLGRNVKKQMTGAHSTALSFRVKHYPGNPIADFHQEISQYLLYLQIRRDLVQGRLLCPLNELYMIGALILQSEYGDAPGDDGSKDLNGCVSSEEEYLSYFKNLKIVFNQTKKIETEIIEKHKTLRGLTARDAEVEVIKRASKLPTYGVDPFPVKIITKEKHQKRGDAVSAKNTPANEHQNPEEQSTKSAPATSNASGSVYLGLRHTGLTTYVGLQPSEDFECKSGSQIYIGPKCTQGYAWNSIERLACDGKDFIVYLKPLTDREETAGLPSSVSEHTEFEGVAAAAAAAEEKGEVSAVEKASDGKKTSKSKKAAKSSKAKKPKKEGAKSKMPAQEATPKKTKKSGKPRVVTFRCDTKAAALALWKWTVDRQSFFTLKEACEAKTKKTTHSLFRRSHSYRFIGKSQMELKLITDSADSLPQPSFVRVSSLRRPKHQEGDFGSPATRATLPARIRSADASKFASGETSKRPALQTNAGDQLTASTASAITPAATPSLGVVDIAQDLLAAPGSESNTPVKSAFGSLDAVEPVSISPVSAATTSAAASHSSDVAQTQLRNRANHTNEPVARDSECLRAVKEIDEVIDQAQDANGHKKSGLPNGEVACRDTNAKTSTSTSEESNRSLVYALETAAAVVGLVFVGVVIAALETHPATAGSGQQSGLWTDVAMQLQGQPLVQAFNYYIYAPLRGFLIGGRQ